MRTEPAGRQRYQNQIIDALGAYNRRSEEEYSGAPGRRKLRSYLKRRPDRPKGGPPPRETLPKQFDPELHLARGG